MSHIDKIRDTETLFIIDPETREISTASSGNNNLVQYDHNSERYTFEIPRYVDGHDMFECTQVRIYYRNADSTNWSKTNGVYVPTDLAIVDGDENKLRFTWLVSSVATQHAGYLHFSIQFICLDGETVEYSWSTATYKDITVLESINHGEDFIVDPTDAMAERLKEIVSEVVGTTSIAPQAKIAYVTLLANDWSGSDGSYSQVVDIDGVTENSQVDLTPSADQIAIFHEKDLAFVTENEDGVVTVYAIGQKPTSNYTIQVTITEVTS